MSSNPSFSDLYPYYPQFIRKPGEHGIIYGTTGSGKTNQMIEIVLDLIKAGETIIYRDYGKEVETLSLARYYPLKIFYPEADDISLEVMNLPDDFKDISYFSFSDPEEILNNLSTSEINVISMRRFLRDPATFNRFWHTLLELFIDYALSQRLPYPLTFALDEMNNITPGMGRGYSTNSKINSFSNNIAFNFQNLRATQTRILATSHGITAMHADVRRVFQWYFFKKLNEHIDIDISRLKLTQGKVQSLQVDEVVAVLPSKTYTDPIGGVPFHLQLTTLPRDKQPHIKYNGVFTYAKPPKEITKNDIGALKKGIAIELINKHGLSKSEVAELLKVTPRQVTNYLQPPKPSKK